MRPAAINRDKIISIHLIILSITRTASKAIVRVQRAREKHTAKADRSSAESTRKEKVIKEKEPKRKL